MKRNKLGRFEKGNIPYNKGVRRGSFMGSIATQFKKGEKSHNILPIGTRRKDSAGYIRQKIQDHGKRSEQWRLLHQLLWEKEHGPIPKSCKIIFLDGDKENLALENLKLATTAEVLALNHSKLRFKNKELTNTGLGIVKVDLKIKQRDDKNGR